MKNYLLILFLVVASDVTMQAQQYYIKLNGDTIYGKANLNPILDNSRSIRFVKQEGEKIELKPSLTKMVFHSKEHVYKPVVYRNQRLFMIVEEEGHLSAYRYIYKDGGSTQISRILTKEGQAIEINKFNFKNQMTKFLENCPEVVTGLEEKKYRLRNLPEMVKNYNTCPTSRMVADQNQLPPTPPNPMPTEAGEQISEKIMTTDPSSGNEKKETGNSHLSSEGTTNSEKDKNQIDSFRKYVTSAEGLSNETDILELLKDLESRWQQEGKIPEYLWGALESMTNSNQNISERVRELKAMLERRMIK